MEIPGYTDLEEIGRGGYAIVYRAHQAAFGRSVAIKILTSPSVSEVERTRFEREALAMGRLSWHPNIVVVHETGFTANGQPYLVEEFLEGGSLGGKLQREGPFSPAEAMADLIQLCAATHTAHEADLLHRDIKPDNALIDAFGHIKLADFGIAAVSGSTITATGVVTATIAHAAPEVLNGARATYCADVYSLGSTLFELLTGTPAFVRPDEESIVPLVVRVTNEPVPDLAAMGVPGPVVDIVEQAMAKDPDDRPTTALQLGQLLQTAQQQLGLRVTDLAVRGTPKSRHDDTIISQGPLTPQAVALTPPPAPAPAPAAPTPEPAVTSQSPVVAALSAPTGSVSLPPSTPPAVTGPTPPADDSGDDDGPSSGLLIGLAVVAALLVAAIVYVLVSGGGDDGEAGSTGDTGTDTAQTTVIDTGERPFRIAVGDDAAWVTDSRGTTVDRIDLATNEVTQVEVGGEPAGVDVNGTGVWVSNYSANALVRIDPATGDIGDPIGVDAGPRNVAATDSFVWVANLDADTAGRLDPSTGEYLSFPVGAGPRGIAAGDDATWVANTDGRSVTRIDPDGTTTTIDVDGEPGGGVALTADRVWIPDSANDQLIVLDRATNEILEPIPVGTNPGGITASDDTVYVANSGDDTVSVIDAASRRVTGEIDTGSQPGGLAVTATDLWVANTADNTVFRIPLT